MPIKAEVSAETRLENQSTLTATAHAGAWKSADKVVVIGYVELINPFESEKLSNFAEISARICADSLAESCCSHL
jgi:hypothetical protein